MGTRVWPWAAAAILLLLGDPMAAEDEGAGEALRVHIVCFNFETVQVTWDDTECGAGTNLTFFYRFREDQAFGPCTHYLVRGGRTAGCVLEGPDQVLHFSIRSGSRSLLTMQRWVADYLKPRPPHDLHFLWGQDGVTVTCPELRHAGLLFEVQHRTPYDTEWQAEAAKVCNVTVEGLDLQQCRAFRARLTPRPSYYGPEAAPSDWSPVTHWQAAAPRDSCLQPPASLGPSWPRFFLVCSLVSLLTVALLLLALWKAQRVKRLLMPSVPDPKGTFLGLFEHHQGNFQEWIADTQDVAPWKRLPCGDPDASPEQTLEVHLSAAQETESPAGPGPPSLSTVQEEPPEGRLQLPPRDAPGDNVVSLGGFTFMVTDDLASVRVLADVREPWKCRGAPLPRGDPQPSRAAQPMPHTRPGSYFKTGCY